jgi:tetratricopeptide (TPR) repeat protein
MKHKVYLFLLLLQCSSSMLYAQKTKELTDEERLKFDLAFVNGNREKIIENYDEALKQFRQCYALQPDNAALNYIIGETYYEKKQLEDAERYTTQAVKLDPKNNWYKELLADIYMVSKKYLESGNLLAAMGKSSNNPDYYLKAAYVLGIGKRFNEAIKSLNSAEKIMGITPEVIAQKEQIYLAQNKLSKAADEVKKLIKAFPNDPKHKGSLADLYWSNGKTKEAIAIYQEILQKYPNNGFALFAMADYYLLEKQPEKSFEYRKKGIAAPDVDARLKLQAISYFMSNSGLENAADKLFELAQVFVKAHPNEAVPYLVMGDLYQQQRKFDLARGEYRKAVNIDPSNYTAWQQAVFASSMTLNNEWLMQDCEDAIAHFPLDPSFFAYGAVASIQHKQHEKAIFFARTGLDLATAEQEELLIQLYSTLGDAYYYVKKHDSCDYFYEKALALDSTNTYALNNYAYFLSLRKVKLDKAEAMSKKSIEQEPENASYLDTYGWICYVKGDYQKAKEFIEKSLEKSPNNAEVLEHLGDIYIKLNDAGKALYLWKKAAELGSENESLLQKIKEGKTNE